MSIQVLTLEQVCKERAHWPIPLDQEMQSGQLFGNSGISSTATTKLKLPEVLRHLVTTLTLSLPLDQVLSALSALIMQAVDMDLCIILLRDQVHNQFKLYAWSPDLSEKGVNVETIAIDTELLERLRTASIRGQLPQLPFRLLEALNPLKNVQFETLLPVPLFAGNECIGLLNCYSSKTTHYSDEDQLMLATIATQAALAIKHLQGIDEDLVAQKRLVKTFVNDLCSGAPDGEDSLRRRARILGYDLKRLHAVTLIELSESTTAQEHDHLLSKEERLILYNAVVKQIKQSLDSRYPGSVIDERDNLLVCLLDLEHDPSFDQLNTCLAELSQQIRNEHHILLAAGSGNLCHLVGDYQRGYAEASEALEVGQCLHQEGGCTHFNTLGAYRYIYKFAHTDTLHDQYQNQIDLIVEYDRRKRTNLLETLEIYLECGGNVAKTSGQLDVHRNTLLQRLERLQKLCNLDLEQCQHRLPLLIALKVHKLRTKHAG